MIKMQIKAVGFGFVTYFLFNVLFGLILSSAFVLQNMLDAEASVHLSALFRSPVFMMGWGILGITVSAGLGGFIATKHAFPKARYSALAVGIVASIFNVLKVSYFVGWQWVFVVQIVEIVLTAWIGGFLAAHQLKRQGMGAFTEKYIHSLAEKYGSSILVRRWVGCWVDMVVCAAIILGCEYLLRDAPFHNSALLISLPLTILYFLLGERFFGRTLGKLLTGTVVVDADGARPGFLQVLCRFLFRLLEVNPLGGGGLLAGITVLISKRRQRLGDIYAGTYVVIAHDLPKTSRAGQSNLDAPAQTL